METRVAERLLPGLERRLKAEIAGAVHFDRFTRGRYATDASHYQITPLGVVVPRSIQEAERAIAICRAEGVPVTARGGGSSQAGQTVNHSIIVDCSKHLTRVLDLDAAGSRCRVEPGIVLDDLNRALKPHGLWFPVDVSTASRATIGGMTANNSCGGRSLRYGNTRENVIAIDAVLADGAKAHFGPVAPDLSDVPANSLLRPLAAELFALGARERDEIAARFPKVQRRVGGYNIDSLVPGRNDVNLAHILVGSEGTLAFSTAIELKLSPLLGRRSVGACHFGSFHEAMAAAQHIVKLGPIAVELVDATMIALARAIAMFRPTLEAFVRGQPAALLLVEFAEAPDENARRLTRLHELMGDLGFSWDKSGAKWGGVADVLDPKLQAAITDLRTAGLNIMMSMKQQGKPVSFVEDCAVPLDHLADYTARLTDVFERNGTSGTAQSSTNEIGLPASFIDIMMLRPAVRNSVIAACSFGSWTSTTPPHLAPLWRQSKPRSPISSCRRCSRRSFSSGASANSTSSSAAGRPCTKASKVGRNMAMSRASAIIVASTSSTAIGASLTMCCAAAIASWKLPKWQAPTARRPSTGESLISIAVEKASVPSEPTRMCARLTPFRPGTSASML
jgi:FAD/FMN-containing dehydrogenase